MAQPPRVVIIGAGPAGVRCAETLVAAGLRPTVVDENRRDGGQIYRRQPDNFTRPYTKLYGTEAGRAQALHACFDALRAHVDYHPNTLAWNIADQQVHVACGEQASALPFDALVICAGATILAEGQATTRVYVLLSGWAFRFPAQAAGALAGLDPREAVAVEFLFATPDGDAVRRAYVEVGDFAAGRAFLHVASR